jgi:hypothetical protein
MCQSYRRFQVNFQQSADATSFINAIRHVCPCKANGPPQGLPTRSVTINPRTRSSQMPPPEIPMDQTRRSIRPSMTTQATSGSNIDPESFISRQPAAHGPPLLDVSSQATIAHVKPANVPRSASLEALLVNSGTASHLSRSQSYAPLLYSTTNATVSSTSGHSNVHASTFSTIEGRAMTETSGSVIDKPSVFQSQPSSSPSNDTYLRSVQQSLSSGPLVSALPPYDSSDNTTSDGIPARKRPTPNSSYNTSMTQGLSMTTCCVPTPVSLPPPQQPCSTHPPEPITAPTEMTNDFIATIRNDTSLYKLSRGELESLVANVIREPGFIDLVSIRFFRTGLQQTDHIFR